MTSPVAKYLDQFPHPKTRTVYRTHILAYLEAVTEFSRAGKAATAAELAEAERIATEYLRNPAPVQDLTRFVRALAGTPPNTASLRFNVAVDWLGYHGHEISARDRKAFVARLPRGGTQTIEADLDRDRLASIIHHLDSRGRAIMLVLVSSGMRIGELLQVPMRDVNLDASPAEIILRGTITKTGAPRTVFISAEAANAVREWLAVRDDVLARSIGRMSGLYKAGRIPEKHQEDDRLFPFSAATVRDAWTLACEKVGLHGVDPTTGRATRHIHMLRKYFLSQAKLGAPAEVIEMLAGHAGYLSSAYRRYTKQQLAEYYLKAEPYLTILVPGEYLEARGKLAEKLSAHSDLLEGVMADHLKTKAQLERMEAQMATLQALLQEDRVIAAAQELASHHPTKQTVES